MYLDFETTLANHCAPVLFCKKPAALISEKCLPENCAWKELRLCGFHLLRLHWRGHIAMTFIYHPGLLNDRMAQDIVRSYLTTLGYPERGDCTSLLCHLRRRFKESFDFPHEVGFFLGYPPRDVIEFIEGKAECKLCGPWKVYYDEKDASAMFEEFAHCRTVLLHHIKNGGSILSGTLPALAG